MLRKLLSIFTLALSLALAGSASAQLSTIYSQGNGNATSPFTATPAFCGSALPSGVGSLPASGIDINGNALCIPLNSVNLLAQTAALSGQVLCTAANCPAGFYQVTIYSVATTVATVGTIAFSLQFTDDAQAQNIALITGLSLLSKTPGQATYSFWSSGAGSITFGSTFSGVTGSPAYAVHATVRRIG